MSFYCVAVSQSNHKRAILMMKTKLMTHFLLNSWPSYEFPIRALGAKVGCSNSFKLSARLEVKPIKRRGGEKLPYKAPRQNE